MCVCACVSVCVLIQRLNFNTNVFPLTWGIPVSIVFPTGHLLLISVSTFFINDYPVDILWPRHGSLMTHPWNLSIWYKSEEGFAIPIILSFLSQPFFCANQYLELSAKILVKVFGQLNSLRSENLMK